MRKFFNDRVHTSILVGEFNVRLQIINAILRPNNTIKFSGQACI